MAKQRDVIFLLPGFLGFDAIGSFTYFSDLVRSILVERLADGSGRKVHVEILSSLPTSPLRSRQSCLLEQLRRFRSGASTDDDYHFVGHSAGGLDALFLLREVPLDDPAWTEEDLEIRSRIRTIVGVATPFDGTTLAQDRAVAELARLIPLDPRAYAELGLWAIPKLVWSTVFDRLTVNILSGVLRDPVGSTRYVLRVLLDRGLIRDLTPSHVRKLRGALDPGLVADCRIQSIAVMTADETTMCEHADGSIRARKPDGFFRWLRRQTEHPVGSEAPEPASEAAVEQIQAALDDDRVVGNPHASRPPVDGRVSDGVVNTARQVFDPTRAEGLPCVVVADHFDVAGYFDARVPPPEDQGAPLEARSPRPIRAGLLKSGSCFQYAHLCELYERVADCIAEAPRAHAAASGGSPPDGPPPSSETYP